MKLSKTLLSAIIIGIAVQTVSSCKKDKDATTNTLKQKIEQKKQQGYPCPACGMG